MVAFKSYLILLNQILPKIDPEEILFPEDLASPESASHCRSEKLPTWGKLS